MPVNYVNVLTPRLAAQRILAKDQLSLEDDDPNFDWSFNCYGVCMEGFAPSVLRYPYHIYLKGIQQTSIVVNGVVE